MRRRAAVCGFLPPYILRSIAENGDPSQRAFAMATMEHSEFLRGERAVVAALPAMLAVPAGGKRRTVYDAGNRRTLPGARVRGEGEKKTGDAAVDEAYDGSGKTYDFFSKVFERNSIDGRGMRLESTVHYGVRYANAQWNGRQMIYGDGDGMLFQRFTRSLDVIAHELTHGITQHTASLAYHDQPGALNEHFSDVFGALVKQHARRQTAEKADWLIGAELFAKGINGQAVRSMKAPGSAYDDKLIGKDPQPAHMRDYVEGEDDNGGVHVNSGIPNHAFYLVATALGGSAWDTAGRIWYRTLTRRLFPESGFEECARATFQAAGELFGPRSEPQRAVAEAWRTVGIPLPAAVLDEGTRIPIRRKPVLAVATGAAEMPIAVPKRVRT